VAWFLLDAASVNKIRRPKQTTKLCNISQTTVWWLSWAWSSVSLCGTLVGSAGSSDDARPLTKLGFNDAKIRFRCPSRVMSSSYRDKIQSRCLAWQTWSRCIRQYSKLFPLTAIRNKLSLLINTHIRLTAFFWDYLGERWAGTRKVKPIWILLKQETVSGSGISWAICKSASPLAPDPHHSVFYRPDALPAAQPTASKHWRPLLIKYHKNKYIRPHSVRSKFMWPTRYAAAVANDRYLICCLHQTSAAKLLAAIGAVNQWLRRTDRQTLYHFMILTAYYADHIISKSKAVLVS